MVPVPASAKHMLRPVAVLTCLVYWIMIRRKRRIDLCICIIVKEWNPIKIKRLTENYMIKIWRQSFLWAVQKGWQTGQRSMGFVDYPILPCSVRSPSLCRIAVSILRVELPDLLWLFFTPSNHLTINFMPWIWIEEGKINPLINRRILSLHVLIW